MRQGQGSKWTRGRKPRGHHNFSNRMLESNGPDIKVRGTASYICKRYQLLARDAQTQGDHVRAESYLQHAEHYYRIAIAAQRAMSQGQGQGQGGGHPQSQRPPHYSDAPQPDMRQHERQPAPANGNIAQGDFAQGDAPPSKNAFPDDEMDEIKS